MSNRAVFLDRDNTLIEDPGYISHPDQVKLLEGVPEALIELKTLGYNLVVVSNQSAVARGIVTEEVLGAIHDRLKQLLAEKGAYLDKIYYCPYHPEGAVAKYRKESDWRKPEPGMLLAAAKEMNIDLGKSWMIGNNSGDIEAGARAGCKTILLNPSVSRASSPRFEGGTPSTQPDYKSINMREAVNIIKKHYRTSLDAESFSQPMHHGQAAHLAEIEVQQESPETVQPQMDHEQPEPASLEPGQDVPEEQPTAAQQIELLSSILEELKRIQRAEMFSEFSIMRLLAGIAQIIVLFCLLLAIWFLTSPAEQHGAVSVALGFGAVLQLMSLTFYMMQGRR